MKTTLFSKPVILAILCSIGGLSTINAQETYTLPIASDTLLGGVKVGSGLQINKTTGILSVKGIFGSEISLGNKAGTYASSPYSTLIGEAAGYGASSSNGFNNYLGYYAGYNALGGYNNHIGYEAGYNAQGNNTGAIFMGRYAGKNTTSSDGVIFMGGSAGENAQNTTHSCFIAPRAGFQSTNVSKGIYIGYEAGAYSNASYCILIGENAGRSVSSSNKIGNNNIILGNGTTLPGGTSNAFNIGNVLYGTGIQQTTGTYPSYSPLTTGKVGIGVVTPLATLHVNGSMLVTGNTEFGTGTNKYMVIKNGNVGIGTVNPTQKLEVVGNQSISGKLGIGTLQPKAVLDVADESFNTLKSVLARLGEGAQSGEGTYLGVKSYDTQATSPDIPDYKVKSFSIEHKFYGQLNNAINFYRGSSILGGSVSISVNDGTEICKINSLGMDVAGTIRCKEVKVDINAGADFVFAPDYNLKPLAEVEAFIQTNNHLPEIPSEKAMQQEGLNVNEFQIKLLQKIEELTLYTIEQNKAIQAQNKRIEELESKLTKIDK